MTRQLTKSGWLIMWFIISACGSGPTEALFEKPPVPVGYVDRLEIQVGDRVLSFGPFVGYYFKPSSVEDLSQLDFVCFNERSFYTLDLPANSQLYSGHARWRHLPEDTQTVIPADGRRIVPVFFSQAPKSWLNSRPAPLNEYVHFHSAYDNRGAVRFGYWFRHVAQASFNYDMGGRVTTDSPLYHAVEPGPDKQFARIIEFDHGPAG
ncbi:MAG: hypothetical protein K9L30_07415 [Desulfobacterales bacterium]|nr:hypothetical protein [Desulfobacterales bacterium]